MVPLCLFVTYYHGAHIYNYFLWEFIQSPSEDINVMEGFSFELEDLVFVAVSYVLNPQGTSDLSKGKKRLDCKIYCQTDDEEFMKNHNNMFQTKVSSIF